MGVTANGVRESGNSASVWGRIHELATRSANRLPSSLTSVVLRPAKTTADDSALIVSRSRRTSAGTRWCDLASRPNAVPIVPPTVRMNGTTQSRSVNVPSTSNAATPGRGPSDVLFE